MVAYPENPSGADQDVGVPRARRRQDVGRRQL